MYVSGKLYLVHIYFYLVYDPPMKTIYDIRYENLHKLILAAGGTNAKLAAVVGKHHRFTHAYVREREPKNLGSALARSFEAAFGKPVGWMDSTHTIASPQLLETLRYIDEELWAYYEIATPEEKMALIEMVYNELSDLELIDVNPNHQLLSKLVKPRLNIA